MIIGAIAHATNAGFHFWVLATNGQNWRVIFIVVWCFLFGLYVARAVEN